jgi:hypothetical protein
MTEVSQAGIATGQPAEAEAEVRLATASSNGLQFMFGVQKFIVGEMAFAAEELLERATTETHLFSEFVSKLAGSHSVKDLRTMCTECAQHQLDFIRRDSERLFKHSERAIANASSLFDNRAQG